MVGTHADLLVGVEGNAYLAVLNLLMFLQIDHCLHDFGNTRLVVGSKQCGAVGHDQVLANVLQQLWKLLRTRHNTL